MAKILIADDHIVLREGLRALLESFHDWNVVGEASNGFEVLDLVEEHSPDLVILDLTMPKLSGFETISRLRKMPKAPAILVLSAKDDETSVGEAIKAGANGYLPKTSEQNELEFAITSLLKGQRYISPAIASAVINSQERSEEGGVSSPLSNLSSREREVMKLLSEGTPNREVAKILHVSPRTIDSHRANIMKKLGIKSNAELVQIALKYGMIE